MRGDHMKKFLNLLCLSMLLMTWNAIADNSAILGQWQTVDDKTGKTNATVELYEQDGKVYGKIAQLFQETGKPEPVCTKCIDERKDQKVRGMVIIKDLDKKGNEWSGGTILDPKEGKIYKCKIWLEEGKLKVRGYIGFFFRTQTWQPVK
jgi:uncharacterized protein (DUF2147 family)